MPVYIAGNKTYRINAGATQVSEVYAGATKIFPEPNVAPTITPNNPSVTEGDVINFACTYNGADSAAGYQWQIDNADISGATSATYDRTTVLGDNGRVIRCITTDPYGQTAASAGSTMTVAARQPTYDELVRQLGSVNYWLCTTYSGKEIVPDTGTTFNLVPAGNDFNQLTVGVTSPWQSLHPGTVVQRRAPQAQSGENRWQKQDVSENPASWYYTSGITVNLYVGGAQATNFGLFQLYPTVEFWEMGNNAQWRYIVNNGAGSGQVVNFGPNAPGLGNYHVQVKWALQTNNRYFLVNGVAYSWPSVGRSAMNGNLARPSFGTVDALFVEKAGRYGRAWITPTEVPNATMNSLWQAWARGQFDEGEVPMLTGEPGTLPGPGPVDATLMGIDPNEPGSWPEKPGPGMREIINPPDFLLEYWETGIRPPSPPIPDSEAYHQRISPDDQTVFFWNVGEYGPPPEHPDMRMVEIDETFDYQEWRVANGFAE